MSKSKDDNIAKRVLRRMGIVNDVYTLEDGGCYLLRVDPTIAHHEEMKHIISYLDRSFKDRNIKIVPFPAKAGQIEFIAKDKE